LSNQVDRLPSKLAFLMDSRNDTFSQAPTAVSTPILTASESIKKDDASTERKGVAFTATNTIDTLVLEKEQNIEQDGNPDLSQVSTARKLLLLSMFTLAEFLDAFNNSALFPAIPTLTSQLSFSASEVVWIISAYQLTFAAFLLVVSSPPILISRKHSDFSSRAAVSLTSTLQNQRLSPVLSYSVSRTSSVASPIKRLPSWCSAPSVVLEVP
jgi:hypothetical protein